MNVSIIGTGRLSGRAIVDLDAVREAKKTTSMFDPVPAFACHCLTDATIRIIASNCHRRPSSSATTRRLVRRS